MGLGTRRKSFSNAWFDGLGRWQGDEKVSGTSAWFLGRGHY